MTLRRPRTRGHRRSFTLVESIATIVVLAIVSSVSSGIILQATDGYVDATTKAQLHAEVSMAMDRMVREIRKIPLDTGATGVAPDVSLFTSSLINWDANNSITLSGSDITLKLNGTPRVLISDVTAFTLTALGEIENDLGGPLGGAACDPIRRIEIDLTVQRYGADARVRTRVFIRSTMAGAAP